MTTLGQFLRVLSDGLEVGISIKEITLEEPLDLGPQDPYGEHLIVQPGQPCEVMGVRFRGT